MIYICFVLAVIICMLLSIKVEDIKKGNKYTIDVKVSADEAKKELELMEEQTNRIWLNVQKINASVLEGRQEYGRTIEKTSGKTEKKISAGIGYGN